MGVVRGRVGVLVCTLALVAAGIVPGAGAGAAPQPAGDGLDPTFGEGGKVVVPSPEGSAEYANAVASLPDGSLIVAGTAVPDPDALPPVPTEQIPRVPDGPTPPDVPTFSQSLGSVLLLLRLTPDGRLDPDFGTGGRVWTDLVKAENPAVGDQIPDRYPLGSAGGYALAVQDDGRIIVAGTAASTTSFAFALARYLPDGTLDDSFGDDGLVITELDPLHTDLISTLLISSHGRIVAGGTSGARAALARYLPNGELDRSFGGDGVVFTAGGFLNVSALAQDPDGRIVAAGQGGVYEGPYDFALARYRPDGTLDASFGKGGVVVTDLGGTGEAASGLTFGRDGTLVVAGNSSSAFALARYRADGRLDRAFGKDGLVTAGGTATGATGAGRAFLAMADGSMLLGGGLFGENSRDVAIARYLPDGSRDPAFGRNGLLTTDVAKDRDDEAAAVVDQPGEKLVVAGLSYQDGLDDVLVFVLRYTLAEP